MPFEQYRSRDWTVETFTAVTVIKIPFPPYRAVVRFCKTSGHYDLNYKGPPSGVTGSFCYCRQWAVQNKSVIPLRMTSTVETETSGSFTKSDDGSVGR